jgi:hypothetical protein
MRIRIWSTAFYNSYHINTCKFWTTQLFFKPHFKIKHYPSRRACLTVVFTICSLWQKFPRRNLLINEQNLSPWSIQRSWNLRNELHVPIWAFLGVCPLLGSFKSLFLKSEHKRAKCKNIYIYTKRISLRKWSHIQLNLKEKSGSPYFFICHCCYHYTYRTDGAERKKKE